tara:strand:+ start:326 stop:649 length:324 start_codon:yes stop_codon:yes gene_type:complete
MKIFFKQSIVIIFFLLSACGGTLDSVKRGLSGQKKVSTDEFLVEKKDPLVLPPGYYDLPEPGQTEMDEDLDEKDISSILKVENNNQNTDSSETKGLEESILKKINEN